MAIPCCTRVAVDRLDECAADVHRFVARRVNNRSDAADIAQQALLQATAKLHTFNGENLSGWVFAIARNLIIDHYRTRKRFQFVEVDAAARGESEPSLRTAPDAGLEVCACGQGLSVWLRCIATVLSLEEQVAVLLADIYGHRDKDSAKLLDMTVPSFKLLLHQARARLRASAGGACGLERAVQSTDCEQCPLRPVCRGDHRGEEGSSAIRRRPASSGAGARRLHLLHARLLQALLAVM